MASGGRGGAKRATAKPRASAKPKAKPPAARKPKPSALALARLVAAAKADPRAAEKMAPEVLAMLRTRTEHKRAALALLGIGSNRAIDHALDLYFSWASFELPATLDARIVRKLWERLAARVDDLDLADARLAGLGLDRALADPELGAAARTAIATAVLERMPDRGGRDEAARTLWNIADPATREQLFSDASDVPFETRLHVILRNDPARAYDALVSDFRIDPERRDAILDALDRRADPRWAHEILALVETAPMQLTSVLARLRAADELVDLAARPTLDEVARCALHALGELGDARVSQLIVDWLQTPAGQDRAPMLLTALGTCGDREAAAYLEGQLAAAGGRRAFYQMALDEIRARHPA